jgi:Inner membrane component of T3SS, cytoplasmic domain
MKTTTTSGHFSLKCLDQRLEEALIIDKKKILIGSHDAADFSIKDKSVSSYHAFLCLKGTDGFMVKDLYSEGGVFVNGRKVEESAVFPGDVLTIGTLSFSIEALEDAAPVFNPDEAISSTQGIPSFVELPPRPGLVFVDGEFCDIHFDDSTFKPLEAPRDLSYERDFVELAESQESLDLSHRTQDRRLEVISYLNGLMLDVRYLNLKDGEYFTNPGKATKRDLVFHTLPKTRLFSVTKGELNFHASELLSPSVAWEKISLSDAVFFTHGAEQISLRLVNQSVNWKGIPLFYRDREFYKQGSKVFASIFLPLLVLLFITVPKPEEVKEELAVVYKIQPPMPMQKPTEAKEKSEVKAEELTSKTENSGHKQNDQPADKVEFAAASQNKKVAAKATAPAAAPAKPVATVPVKAYEFNSTVAMGSLVGDAPKINAEGTSAKSAVNDKSFNAGSAQDGELVAGADIGVSKFNGSDKSGSGKSSYGSRGLASKSGFDSSYLEPKTVVLGSMDPELLRKILREYIPQFRHCYQQELIGNSEKIKGVIDLNFTISSTGKVGKYQIKAKDAQFSQKGVGCMGQVLGLIEFPKPKGGGVVDVRQPLNFFAETEKI